jgi:hypothetical protein
VRNPPRYAAIRNTQCTYVEYADGTKEYYDHARDPDQLHNTAAQLPADQAARLHRTLTGLACSLTHGSVTAPGGSWKQPLVDDLLV